MKLELKHLAPYLPYDVRGQFYVHDVYVGAPYEVREKTLKADCVDFFLKYCVLQLRPLSDLNEMIEANGERFMPSEVFQQEYLHPVTWGENGIGKGFMYNSKMIHLVIQDNEIALECPYFIYSKLIEWHFDVFGLIPAGLAIDINQLEPANG